MINNVLTQWSELIILNRIVVDHEDNRIPNVLIHPEKIKEETASHFFKWIEDPTSDMVITPEWMDYYSPRNNIDPAIYNEILGSFTEKDIEEALKQKVRNKILDPNNIPYEILKKLPEQGI